MSFFNQLRKILRGEFINDSEGRFGAGLQELGLRARTGNGACSEEGITSRKRGCPIGVFDTASGPIRWVNVRARRLSMGGTEYAIEYGIPDTNMDSAFPPVNIETVRIKNTPVFGKVVDLRWRGNDFGLSVIRRLTGDDSLRQPIIDSHDLTIEAYPKHGCWVLTTQQTVLTAPSWMLWNCYQSIAGHLLATPIPPNA
jgi:hypothetical protein